MLDVTCVVATIKINKVGHWFLDVHVSLILLGRVVQSPIKLTQD